MRFYCQMDTTGSYGGRIKEGRGENLGRLGAMLRGKSGAAAQSDSEESEVQERFAALGKNSSDLICELGCDLCFVYASPNFRQILHYKPVGLLGREFLGFVHPEDANAVAEELSKLMVNSGSARFLFRMRNADGEWLWFDSSGKAYCSANGEVRSVFISRDVTEQRQIEEQQALLASRDPTTVLFNKQYFIEQLVKAVAATEAGVQSAVVYVDLDNFKLVNDSCGHLAGDRLIIAIAGLLHEIKPERSLLARFGGDEFLFLLNGVRGIEEALELGEAIRASLSEYHFIDSGKTYMVSASVGVVLVDGSVNSREVINRANSASTSAKSLGGNRVQLFNHQHFGREGFREAVRWSERFVDALGKGKFELWYQPVVHTATRAVNHYEALIRLKERDGQIHPPSMFLSPAERFGYIEMLDRYVVEHAIRHLSTHSGRSVAVILSGESFKKPDLSALIFELLEQTGVHPERLIVQIPWPALLSTFEQVSEVFARLRSARVRIGIKNFQADSSSVQYLRKFPVDYLKISGDLMRDLVNSTFSQVAVSAINGIGHALHADTIAEFVDDQPTLDKLREIGIDYAKGYFLGMPEPEGQRPDRAIL